MTVFTDPALATLSSSQQCWLLTCTIFLPCSLKYCENQLPQYNTSSFLASIIATEFKLGGVREILLKMHAQVSHSVFITNAIEMAGTFCTTQAALSLI